MAPLTLHPSRQIRPPIYSLKQSKLRKRRVVRYAILYFVMFFLFTILIIGPAIVRKFMDPPALDIMALQQPMGLDNNDTLGRTPTGAGNDGTSSDSSDDSDSSDSSSSDTSDDFDSSFADAGSSFNRRLMARFVYNA